MLSVAIRADESAIDGITLPGIPAKPSGMGGPEPEPFTTSRVGNGQASEFRPPVRAEADEVVPTGVEIWPPLPRGLH